MTRLAGLTLLATLTAAAPGAAAPRDELLRLVGDDASFCFLMQDLRRHARELGGSPFAERLAQGPFGKGLLASKELRDVGRVEDQFLKHIGLDLNRVVDDWVGDAVVFVYRHVPGGKPADEQGLILTWVRDPAAAEKVIERINELQKGSGELKELRVVEHAGGKYSRRVKNGPKDEFVYRRGNVLAFSSDEDMVRRAVERDRDAPAVESAPPPVSRQLADLGVESAMLVWWLNPRRFDADLQ